MKYSKVQTGMSIRKGCWCLRILLIINRLIVVLYLLKCIIWQKEHLTIEEKIWRLLMLLFVWLLFSKTCFAYHHSLNSHYNWNRDSGSTIRWFVAKIKYQAGDCCAARGDGGGMHHFKSEGLSKMKYNQKWATTALAAAGIAPMVHWISISQNYVQHPSDNLNTTMYA